MLSTHNRDIEQICDLATYLESQIYPAGILTVIISGKPVGLRGQLQANWPGKLLAPMTQVVE